MASRILKLLPRRSLQSFSCVQPVVKPLLSHNGCFYHLSTVLRYSTHVPNTPHKPVNQERSVPITPQKPLDPSPVLKKRTPVQEFEDKFKTPKYHAVLQEQGYLPIYKFRHIAMFAAMNKVKYQQLYLTSGIVLVGFILASLGVITTEIPIGAGIIGGVITSTFWIFTGIFKRVVGVILVSPDDETVCISFVNSKGDRQDDLIPARDLVPLYDLPSQKYFTSYFIQLHRYQEIDEEGETCYKPYTLFIQNYDILEKKKFMEVFGSLL